MHHSREEEKWREKTDFCPFLLQKIIYFVQNINCGFARSIFVTSILHHESICNTIKVTSKENCRKLPHS